jgi:chromosome segregation ATPase
MGKWRTLFHPFRAWLEHENTRVDLDAALERERACDARIAAMEAQIEQQTAQIAELTEKATRASKQAEANMHELLRVRREYDEYRHTALDHDEIQQQVKEITDMVDKVEAMKEHYERRIKMLKHALADARAIIKDRSDYDSLHQLAVIDMDAKKQRTNNETLNNTIENTDMKSKTNSEYYTPSLFDEPERSDRRVPDLDASNEPARDWLQPLPED